MTSSFLLSTEPVLAGSAGPTSASSASPLSRRRRRTEPSWTVARASQRVICSYRLRDAATAIRWCYPLAEVVGNLLVGFLIDEFGFEARLRRAELRLV